MPFHLYIHLPFCRRKCPYCDFFKLTPKRGQTRDFVEVLLCEIELAHQQNNFTDPLKTVYFGGGTPSLHPPEEIKMILDKIREFWEIEPDAEITLETNPGTVNLSQLVELKSVGINRLSIGAQSFSSRKLELLYRDHVASETVECVSNARLAGFKNISLDLIFGLNNETMDEWKNDMEEALRLEPDHISLYNLEYHEGTPYFRWKSQGKLSALGEDLEAEMYLTTHELLCSRGYEHYEVSNFSKPNFHSIHNSAYWQGKPYLGIGPSAHSFDGIAKRWKNIALLEPYLQSVKTGKIPAVELRQSSPKEQAEEWISLNLRVKKGIQFSEAVKMLGNQQAHLLWKKGGELPLPLRNLSSQAFSLTPQGWFQENTILLYLYQALNENFPRISA